MPVVALFAEAADPVEDFVGPVAGVVGGEAGEFAGVGEEGVATAEAEASVAAFDGGEAALEGGGADTVVVDQVTHGGGQFAEDVAPAGFKCVAGGGGVEFGEFAVGGDALGGVGEEGGREVGAEPTFAGIGVAEAEEVEGEGDFAAQGDAAGFELFDGFFEDAAVEVEADGGDVAGLFGAEEVACAAYFQVAHGDFEAAAEFAVLADGGGAFAGLARAHHGGREEEVGVGLLGGAADAATELIEVGEAEAVGAVNKDGVDVGHINAAFDDGGGDEDVGAAVEEVGEGAFDVVFVHAAVGAKHAQAGQEGAEFGADGIERGDAVVKVEDLAAAFEFALDGGADDAFVVGEHVGLDRDAAGGRGLDGGEVARTHEGEVEGAGDGSSTEGEDVYAGEAFFNALFVAHSEALFLVHDEEARAGEEDFGGEDAVGADEEVALAGGAFFEDGAGLCGVLEAAHEAYGDGVVAHAAGEGVVVLAGEDGGGAEDDDLAAVHDGFEGGADGDFGFAKADVAAEEAVHGAGGFHVAFDVLDGSGLVGSEGIGEGVFKFLLPVGVGGEGVAGVEFAFGLEGEEFGGVVEDGAVGGNFFTFPTGAAEGVEFGAGFAGTDVTGDEVGLSQGDVEARGVGVFEEEDFFVVGAAKVDGVDAKVAANAVLEVDDVIAFDEFGDVGDAGGAAFEEGLAGGTRGCGDEGAVEDFGVGEEGEFVVGQEEAAGEWQGVEGDLCGPIRVVAGKDFAQAGDFTSVLSGDVDVPAVREPVADVASEQCGAGVEGEGVAGRGVEVVVLGDQRRGQAVLGVKGDGERVRGEVVGEGGGGVAVVCGCEDSGVGQGGAAALGGGVEGVEGFDALVVPLDADGQASVGAEDVEHSAACGKLAGGVHLGNRFVTGFEQAGAQCGGVT